MTGDISLLEQRSLFDYFRPYVREALGRRLPDAKEQTEFYLVKLLSENARAQTLFNGVGRDDPALGLQLGQALTQAPPGERVGVLKRLGDYTLYMTGFFSGGLNVRLVDLAYYKKIGQAAYYHLARTPGAGDLPMNSLFGELAERFEGFVEVLGLVGDRSRPPSDAEIVHLYAAWFERGCSHSAQRLQRLGFPLPTRTCAD